MPWTPLHSALGETGTDLDFALVQRACASRLAERGDLDWKRQLPLTADKGDVAAKQNQQAELAKDVAAMANSGGGMIVYGVAESLVDGTAAADRIVPIGHVDDTTMKAIRQTAANLVYPPVTDLMLHPLAAPDDPACGVLVLSVPDSVEAPHLVHPRHNPDWFAVPYRHGPETQWMVERQIATAYRTREAGRRLRLADLDDKVERFVTACGPGNFRNWVVAVAVPETPLPRPRALQLGTAHRIIDHAWTWPFPNRLGPRDMTQGQVTRRGMQRFVRTGTRTITSHNATMRGRVEVHGDGTVAVGFTRDGAFDDTVMALGHVAVPDIEQVGLDLFALLWTTARGLGVTGDYMARITVEPTTESFRRADPGVLGAFTPFDETQPVFDFGPVDGPVLTGSGREAALESWLDLIDDAVSQTGVRSALDREALALELGMDDD